MYLAGLHIQYKYPSIYESPFLSGRFPDFDPLSFWPEQQVDEYGGTGGMIMTVEDGRTLRKARPSDTLFTTKPVEEYSYFKFNNCP